MTRAEAYGRLVSEAQYLATKLRRQPVGEEARALLARFEREVLAIDAEVGADEPVGRDYVKRMMRGTT